MSICLMHATSVRVAIGNRQQFSRDRRQLSRLTYYNCAELLIVLPLSRCCVSLGTFYSYVRSHPFMGSSGPTAGTSASRQVQVCLSQYQYECSKCAACVFWMGVVFFAARKCAWNETRSHHRKQCGSATIISAREPSRIGHKLCAKVHV